MTELNIALVKFFLSSMRGERQGEQRRREEERREREREKGNERKGKGSFSVCLPSRLFAR